MRGHDEPAPLRATGERETAVEASLPNRGLAPVQARGDEGIAALGAVISPASRLLDERPTRRSGWLNTARIRAVSSGVMIASQFPGPRIARSRRSHVAVVFDAGS